MKTLKPASKKEERERKVLIGLIEHYLVTGKPVGSQTLKEEEFADLSSATIRNYFANLEKNGFLKQQHISGGREPTDLAFRYYANEYARENIIDPQLGHFDTIRLSDTKEIASYLQKSAETLSSMTDLAVFLSAPRFDHDFIAKIKLVPIDITRVLGVVITDFGVVQTEVFHLETKLTAHGVSRIEDYFHWRLTGHHQPENLEEGEEALAQKLYNELMLRYIVGYSTFTDEEIYRTGFSKLLNYPDFQDSKVLANSLALFENAHSMRLLLRESAKLDELRVWVSDDLAAYSSKNPKCGILAIPYRINQQAVGSVGVLGPVRMPYRELYGILEAFSNAISQALTRNIYKFKISFRQPDDSAVYLQKEENQLLGQSRLMLLEDQRKGANENE